MEVSSANLLIIAIIAAAAPALLALFHWMIPRYMLRFLRWVDDIIPADQSSFMRPIARFAEIVLGSVVVLAAAFAIASQMGADMSGVLDTAGDGGVVVGKWLLARALSVTVIVVVAILAIRVINHFTGPIIQQYLSHRDDAGDDPGEVEKRSHTLQGVLSNTLSVIIMLLAFFMILSELGVNITPILAGAGVVGLAVAFGAQSLIKDIFSGVFILLEDQFRVGDVAAIGGVTGIVEDINLRRTTLRDWDYTQHIVPNGEIRVASNLTKEKSRVYMNIEVAYKEDLDRVMDVITRVGEELSADPDWGEVITDPLRAARVSEFAASGIAIKVVGETVPMQQWAVAGEFRRRIKRVFDYEGIEIPFPHVTLFWGDGVRTPVDLSQGERPAAAPGSPAGPDADYAHLEPPPSRAPTRPRAPGGDTPEDA